ncbi:MAG: ABC transporter permease [Opitutaceae bacterium]|jgi:ABC-2 type transport system permease protein
MHPILVLFGKDMLMFWKDRAALVITFLVPIMLIFLFGYVFGLNRKDSGPSGIPLAVVNLSPEPAALDLVDALKAEKTFRIITTKKMDDGKERPLTEADVRAALKNNEYRFALILPEDLLPDDSFGVRMKFLIDPRNEIETQTVTGMLQKNIFSKVPQLLGQSLQKGAKRFLGEAKFENFNRRMADTMADSFGGDREKIYQDISKGSFGFDNLSKTRSKPADPTLRRLDSDISPTKTMQGAKEDNPDSEDDLFSNIVNIEKEQVSGKQVKNPMASRLVGGYAVMFLLFAVTGSVISLFEDKRTGIFQRLLASPVSRAHVLWSKFLSCMAIGLIQLTVMFVFGHLLYDLDLPQHVFPLLVVSLCVAAACSSIGMLIVSIAPTQAAAHGLTTLVVLSMSSIGGAWFPVSFMPEFIQKISRLTIVYWSMEGFTSVLWAGQGVMEILPILGILLGISAGFMAIAVWRFNSGRMFD